jgi:hypothetical protein
MSAFSQIEYFNHNACDKYTIRKWDKATTDSLRIPKLIHKFSTSKFYNFSDSLNDLAITNSIKSNVLITDLLIFNKCFEKNCDCFATNRLDTINIVFSNKLQIEKIKLLCSFNPFPNIISIIVLIQTSRYSIDCHDCKELNVYLINFDNAYNIISTAFIGEFSEINDGLSYSRTDSKITIRRNMIISNRELYLFPTDIAIHFHLSKSHFTTYNKYKIRINDYGRIEKIK